MSGRHSTSDADSRGEPHSTVGARSRVLAVVAAACRFVLPARCVVVVAGAFVNDDWFEYESDPTHAWGLRPCVDWPFADGAAVLGAEANPIRPFHPSTWQLAGAWGRSVPWAGLTLSARIPPLTDGP